MNRALHALGVEWAEHTFAGFEIRGVPRPPNWPGSLEQAERLLFADRVFHQDDTERLARDLNEIAEETWRTLVGPTAVEAGRRHEDLLTLP